jgi:hypothetical protein
MSDQQLPGEVESPEVHIAVDAKLRIYALLVLTMYMSPNKVLN